MTFILFCPTRADSTNTVCKIIILRNIDTQLFFVGGTNIGSAVATSINLTNSSEPMGEASAAPHYKMEPAQDLYYQV